MAKKAEVTETRTPLIVNGEVAVDPKKCPTLHRVLTLMLQGSRRSDWAKVVELRASGQADEADRAARKAMGVKGEPMTEETKEKLRQYNEEHKEEIKERAQLKRQIKARTRAIMKPSRGRR